VRRLVDAFSDIFIVIERFGEFVLKYMYLVACVICNFVTVMQNENVRTIVIFIVHHLLIFAYSMLLKASKVEICMYVHVITRLGVEIVEFLL